MLRFLSSLVVSVTLASSAFASNWTVAIPVAAPGGGEAIKEALWDFFIRDLGPGDTYAVLNAATPGQIANLRIPDEVKYTRAKWRAKTFASENARIGGFVDGIDEGAAKIDLLGTLRHVALNRLDNAPIDLLVIGGVVQIFPEEPHFSMQGENGLLVPSPAHLSASVADTPYGMGSEGSDGLQAVTVHLCSIGDALSSDAEAAYQQFFSAYIAARGGVMVTWSDDLPTCLERFGGQARQPIEVPALEINDDTVEMREITRSPVTVVEEEPTTVIVNGIEVDQFNLFSSASHPTLSGVEVTTGIVYEPGKYPDVYQNAYCYFPVMRNGTSIRIDLGDKDFGEDVEWHVAPASALKSAGISERDFEAGRSACQWPTS